MLFFLTALRHATWAVVQMRSEPRTVRMSDIASDPTRASAMAASILLIFRCTNTACKRADRPWRQEPPWIWSTEYFLCPTCSRPGELQTAETLGRAAERRSEGAAARHRPAAIEGANQGTCTRCERHTQPENLARCPHCGFDFCENCIMFCRGCENIRCRACPCLCSDDEVAANDFAMGEVPSDGDNRPEGSPPDAADAGDVDSNRPRAPARGRMRELDEQAARTLLRAGPHHRQQLERRNRDVWIRILRVRPTAGGLGFGPNRLGLDVPERMHARRLHQVVEAEVGQSVALLCRDRARGFEFMQNEPHGTVSMRRRRTIFYCLDEDLLAIVAVLAFDGAV